MNADDIIHRSHEDSFKEVEIQDMSDGNNIIYVPRATVKQDSSIQAINNVHIIEISEKDIKFNQIISFGRFLKWVTFIEFLTVFTYFIVGLPALLCLLIFPILGFLAAKKIYKALGVIYLIYLIGSILLRIILIVAYRYLAFIIIGSFLVVFNIICIRYLVRFLKIVKEISQQDREELLILQNGIQLKKNFQGMHSN